MRGDVSLARAGRMRQAGGRCRIGAHSGSYTTSDLLVHSVAACLDCTKGRDAGGSECRVGSSSVALVHLGVPALVGHRPPLPPCTFQASTTPG